MKRDPYPVMTSTRLDQRGVSLVELMVAMTIALLVATAMASLYVSSKSTFRTQTASSTVREGGMALVEDLSREIRRAGNYGCFGGRDTGQGASFLTTARMPSATGGRFPLPVAADGTPRLGPIYAVFGGPASSLTGSGITPRSGTDYLEFNFGEPITFLSADMEAGTSPLQLGRPIFVSSGQPLLVGSCTRMTLLRADNGGLSGASTSTISHDPSLGDNVPLGNPILYHLYSRGATVMQLAATRLFVATNTTTGKIALYKQETISSNGGTPQPFIPNVEDMRVRFLVDVGGTKTWQDAATVNSSGAWGRIEAVRVHVLIASEERSPQDAFLYTWDESRGFIRSTTNFYSDGFPRRTFNVTTAIRGRVEIGGV